MKHTELTGIEVFPHEAKLSASRRRYKINPDSNVFSFRRNILSGNSRRLLKLLTGAPGLSFSDIASGRPGRIKGIKSLVKSGRYETEEKIKITAARILETFQIKAD